MSFPAWYRLASPSRHLFRHWARLIASAAAVMLTFAVAHLPAATITVNGNITYQKIDGFGVNANHRSWNPNELPPILDALIDQAGMTLFRIVYDNSDWEAVNDNGDPSVMNWTYYDPIYSNTEFTKLWDMSAYLNNRGIVDGVIYNFQGPGPAWMCGSSDPYSQKLTAGMENEWAEMITSQLWYARNIRGIQFHSVMPNNEPDIAVQGVRVSGGPQYALTIHDLALQLNANGLSDVTVLGPDLSASDNTYYTAMEADPTVMAKIRRLSVHGWGGTGSVAPFIASSSYPNIGFWVSETNVWCSVCDFGQRGTYDWTYCEGTASDLMGRLIDGASAVMEWEAYDSFYLIPNNSPTGNWSFWGLFSIDDENAAVKTYTPRKNFYTVAQITKFVRPGSQRIDVSGSSSPFLPLLAFQNVGLGQVTVVGINPATSATSLTCTLKSVPAVATMDLYYTSSTVNLVHMATVPVSNGTFTATIPADCVFTLTGSLGVNVAVTSPTAGARYNAPASIPLAATASSAAGAIEEVDFFNGSTALAATTTSPYQYTWSNVPMGDYVITAAANDTVGNTGVSAGVSVAVVGPLATVTVSPNSAVVAAGATQQFSASGTDAVGHTISGSPTYSWSVNGGGTIDSTGKFTAGSTAGGPFTVSATSSGISGNATVTVTSSGGGGGTSGTIGNSTDGTSTDTIGNGGTWINACRFQATSSFTATAIKAKVYGVPGKYKCAIYSDSSTKPSALLQSTVEVSAPSSGWQTFTLSSPLALTSGTYYWLAVWSNDTNARVYYSGTNGTLRWASYAYGTWPNPISTTGGSTLNYCIYATGSTATLSSISVTPASPTISAGSTQSFTATGTYSDASTQNLTSQVTWASSSTSVATINTSGLASGVAGGTTTISANLSGTTGSTTLTVNPVVTLSSIAVTPTTPTIVNGATQQFTATGTYSDASTQNLTSQVTWASSSTSVATINSAGLASSVGSGTTSITAKQGSITGGTSLTVQPAALSVSTTSLAPGNVGTAYSQTFTATGGTPSYSWSMTVGSLPAGLSLNSSTGAITGTPTAAGTSSFTIQVTDSSTPTKTATKNLSITITANATVYTLWAATAVPSSADVGADNPVELGVKFKSDVAGTITGIRFYKSAANTGVHVGNLWSSTGTNLATATFSGETASGWQQVNFSSPVTISANTTYIASYHCVGGHFAADIGYFASTGVDRAPLHAPSNASAGGQAVFTYGTNSAFPTSTWNSSNYWVDVAFQASSAATLTSIAITPANFSLPAGSSQQFTATGTYSDSSTQNLTSQVTWASSNSSCATINASGVATGVAAGTTTLSGSMSGVSGSTTLTVLAPTLAITTTTLPSAVTGTLYTTSLAASGGTTPYSWTLSAGALPAGLSLSAAGVINGTPTSAGTATFTVKVTDAGSPAQNATKSLTLTANNVLNSITVTPANAGLQVGSTQQFTATGTYSDNSTQNLTSQVVWASSVTAKATISSAGLATGASVGSTTISATLGSVVGSTTLTVQTTPPVISTTTLANAVAGIPYSATLAASGGTTPYSWSLASGTLPAGLNLSAAGVISGTPTASGTATFTVKVTDSGSPATSATQSLSLTVAAGTAYSIWPSTVVPGRPDAGADSSVELGIKIRSDVAGYITGIRFYKYSTNTGTHVANLWSNTGTLLATATFTGESTSGWQQVNFSSPVAVSANTVYIASYHCNAGHFSADISYFASTGVDNAPLHAPSNASAGGQGVFHYSTSPAFPDTTWSSSNYWVDLVFVASP